MSLVILVEMLNILLWNIQTGYSTSLKLVMLEVPSPSYNGESVELACIYELENDTLYSVKWQVDQHILSVVFLIWKLQFSFNVINLIHHIGIRTTSSSIGKQKIN